MFCFHSAQCANDAVWLLHVAWLTAQRTKFVPVGGVMGGEGLEKHNHLYVAWFTCHTLHEVTPVFHCRCASTLISTCVNLLSENIWLCSDWEKWWELNQHLIQIWSSKALLAGCHDTWKEEWSVFWLKKKKYDFTVYTWHLSCSLYCTVYSTWHLFIIATSCYSFPPTLLLPTFLSFCFHLWYSFDLH